MTLDPEFRLDAGVGPQTNLHQATQVTECAPDVYVQEAAIRMDFPDGTSERVRERVELGADGVCRTMGALGARGGGCAAILGVRPVTRPALLLVGVGVALVVRRRRR